MMQVTFTVDGICDANRLMEAYALLTASDEMFHHDVIQFFAYMLENVAGNLPSITDGQAEQFSLMAKQFLAMEGA